MAVIGSLGEIIFSVSNSQVNTFDGLVWDSSAKYAKHDRHLKTTLIEFLGTDADKISFSMYFSVFLGIDPLTEIIKLLNAERGGVSMRLVIGSKAYGRNKWVIESSSKELERFDNKGNILSAKINVSLIADAGR